MKERPILFSGPMVRAILDGKKSQTRRVVKHQEVIDAAESFCDFLVTKKAERLGPTEIGPRQVGHICKINDGFGIDEAIKVFCPYGQPGDRLWVKETTVKVEDHGYQGPVYAESEDGRSVIEYGLSPSPDDMTEVEPHEIKLRPSLFMTRAMSRILLEITAVRVEQLQDISDEDALAEGVYPTATGLYPGSPRAAFRQLWWRINGAGSWAANPWVWAVEFRRIVT